MGKLNPNLQQTMQLVEDTLGDRYVTEAKVAEAHGQLGETRADMLYPLTNILVEIKETIYGSKTLAEVNSYMAEMAFWRKKGWDKPWVGVVANMETAWVREYKEGVGTGYWFPTKPELLDAVIDQPSSDEDFEQLELYWGLTLTRWDSANGVATKRCTYCHKYSRADQYTTNGWNQNRTKKRTRPHCSPCNSYRANAHRLKCG